MHNFLSGAPLDLDADQFYRPELFTREERLLNRAEIQLQRSLRLTKEIESENAFLRMLLGIDDEGSTRFFLED